MRSKNTIGDNVLFALANDKRCVSQQLHSQIGDSSKLMNHKSLKVHVMLEVEIKLSENIFTFFCKEILL